MNSAPFKLALIQMKVCGGEMERNLHSALEHISEAAHQGANVALLPECMDLGWTHPSSQTMASEIPNGDVCRALSTAAKQNRIYICAGITEKTCDKVFNSAVIIDKEGNTICHHRKLNELDIGHDYYAQGDRLNVANTEYGTFGLMICADGFANDQVITRTLGYMGADIILSPSAWAVPADHDNIAQPYGNVWRDSYIPIAKEFSVHIIGVSNVGPITDGPWKGRNCIGCSLAIDPNGIQILQGPYGIEAESILYLDITPTPRPTRGTGWADRKSNP
ncbi:carbon-nitrogen hydrolase family protein [Verrucomicrobia bacterium]|nr:carbon-nitrogen hydrolase family protein [Verrucomicrobiota bacterium]